MNDSIPGEPKPDPEMTAIIARFEQAYAEPDAHAELQPVNAASDSLFPERDYEFPPEPDAPVLDEPDIAAAADRSQHRAQMESAESSNGSGATPDEDVESALALLRAGERRAHARGEMPRNQVPAAMREPAPLSTTEPRSKSFRHLAVPGAAIAVFVGFLGGYLATRGDIPSSAAIVPDVPAAITTSPLRLDYDLAKPTRRDTVAQTRSR